MTNKLITLERAKRKAKKLQHYIDLVENYHVDSLDKWIIKKYAETNSMKKILEIAKEENILHNNQPLEHEYISKLIDGVASDELHRILRSGYRKKYKPKSKYRSYPSRF